MLRVPDILKPRLRTGDGAGKPAGRPRRRGDNAVPKPQQRLAALIAVDAGGWHLRIFKSEGSTCVREAKGRVELPLEMRDAGEIRRQIEAAAAALSSEDIRELGTIDLDISDPQIEVLDNRLIRGGMSDRESAARLARDVLGCEETAFDVCSFGPHDDGDAERKIIAAVPLDRIRDYLAALGDLAVKVRSITPAASRIVGLAVRQPENMAGSLEVGARHSQIILAEAASGAIVQRVIPVGIADMAERLARAQSLPENDALAMLGERDMFRKRGRSADGRERQSRAEGALLECAGRLAEDLRQTIEDFAENRLAAPPQSMSATGCGGDVAGLIPWLTENAGISLEEGPGEAGAVHGAAQLNLLRGTNEALIIQGRTRYRFRENRFVPVEETDESPRAQVGKPDKATGRRGRKAASAKDSKTDNRTRNRRALILAAIAGALMLTVVAWDNLVQPTLAATQRGQNALVTAVDRATSLRSRLGEMLDTHEQELRVRSQASNKILWTEKFLAISQAIPPGLWLTDTTIIQDERSVGKTDVITTKLLIRGRTLLDDREHLSEVARFIQRLEADETFMSDFRQVTFEGMSPSEGGQLIFELHAWYDQNKRKRAAANAAEDGEEGGALDGLKRQTDERNEIQDRLLRLGPENGGASR